MFKYAFPSFPGCVPCRGLDPFGPSGGISRDSADEKATVFSKMASKLSFNKLRDLAVIPVIWVVQTLVSWLCAVIVSRLFGLKRRPRNFVTAAAVFGNSNSLPISLVLSLSHTLSGLHWSALPNDSDGAVAGRGILYLLLFQQLGQAIRWSWGVNTLLKSKWKYPEYRDEVAEEGALPAGGEAYTDGAAGGNTQGGDSNGESETQGSDTNVEGDPPNREAEEEDAAPGQDSSGDDADEFDPSGRTPVAGSSRGGSPAESDDEVDDPHHPRKPANTNTPVDAEDAVTFPRTTSNPLAKPRHLVGTFKAAWMNKVDSAKTSSRRAGHQLYDRLPKPLQRAANAVDKAGAKTVGGVVKYMNPPLWAMVLAVLVASVPALQRLFFGEGFVKNSVTTAVHSMGAVAVPVILVVLGANLAGKTQGVESHDAEEAGLGWRLLVPSLVCRMVLPPLIMGPVLAAFVKFVPVSILGDPIFVVVNFLLMGAPTALQLAQICQRNEVYEMTMAKVLFQSYVIW